MTQEIISPYNQYNQLITKKDIKELFKKYDLNIDVNNIDIFHEALTHKSYIVSEYTNYNSLILKSIKEIMLQFSLYNLYSEKSLQLYIIIFITLKN